METGRTATRLRGNRQAGEIHVKGGLNSIPLLFTPHDTYFVRRHKRGGCAVAQSLGGVKWGPQEAAGQLAGWLGGAESRK